MADSLDVAFAKLAGRLEKKLKEIAGASAIGGSRFLNELGGYAAEQIRKRTQSGYGVGGEGGSKQRLAGLVPSYIRRRQGFGNLSSLTSPKKSNLTLTGEMFERIGYKIKGSGAGATVTVGFHGSHYSGLSAQELANIHHGDKRPFMYFTDQELKRLTGFYRAAFRRALQQF